MKISRLQLYINMCHCLHEEPTLEGAKSYDKCVDKALKEMRRGISEKS